MQGKVTAGNQVCCVQTGISFDVGLFIWVSMTIVSKSGKLLCLHLYGDHVVLGYGNLTFCPYVLNDFKYPHYVLSIPGLKMCTPSIAIAHAMDLGIPPPCQGGLQPTKPTYLLKSCIILLNLSLARLF